MKRFAATGLTVFLLWALVPAVGELFENALHFVREGHAAHAAPDGDHHDPTGPEHGCTAAAHLCSCCVSLSCLPTHSATVTSLQSSGELLAFAPVHVSAVSGHGVYHPPRV
jgi:hypothetical protein